MNFNYHKDVGFPEGLILPDNKFSLGYTNHALERKEKRYRNVKALPTWVVLHKDNIFEVHTEDNVNCTKVLVRTSYDEHFDIVLVLQLLSDKHATVITLWLNRKGDKHKDFDKSRYTIPNNKINENGIHNLA